MPRTMMKKPVVDFLMQHGFLAGLVLRLVLAWFLPWLLDDGRWIPGVAYTDIDYHVFTDAANLIALGKSPYDRHTYRYTPFLALILSKVNQSVSSDNGGRYFICFADAVCGWIICKLRQLQRKKKHQLNEGQDELRWQEFRDSLWWMFNPFAINICTRGSAESLVALLPVLLTVALVTTSTSSSVTSQGKRAASVRAVLAGVGHGIAVHAKLYPIIYSLSYMAYFGVGSSSSSSHPSQQLQKRQNEKGHLIMRLWDLFFLWFKRLTSTLPLLFFGSFVITTAFLTWLAVMWYGPQALQEGLLYHFSRIDHRHNYSMFWYFIYLIRGKSLTDSQVLSWIGRLLLVPQATLLLYSSLGIGPYDLSFCLFVQTYLFVTFNKVITAQYFTWYLCLLPLCSQSLTLDARLGRATVILLASIVCWLACAYCLEMQGMAVHRLVYAASVGFFFANVNVLSPILQSFARTQAARRKDEMKRK